MLLFIFSIVVQGLLDLAFQNISCYCLSLLKFMRCWLYLYFKTSHVIVYLDKIVYDRESDTHFKTSHVIVYPPCPV